MGKEFLILILTFAFSCGIITLARYFCEALYVGKRITRCGSAWGRLRPPPVAEEGSKKEWQGLAEWRVQSNEDRGLVTTGDVCDRRRWRKKGAKKEWQGLAEWRVAKQRRQRLSHNRRRLRPPPVAEEGSKKEWQGLADWQVAKQRRQWLSHNRKSAWRSKTNE